MVVVGENLGGSRVHTYLAHSRRDGSLYLDELSDSGARVRLPRSGGRGKLPSPHRTATGFPARGRRNLRRHRLRWLVVVLDCQYKVFLKILRRRWCEMKGARREWDFSLSHLGPSSVFVTSSSRSAPSSRPAHSVC